MKTLYNVNATTASSISALIAIIICWFALCGHSPSNSNQTITILHRAPGNPNNSVIITIPLQQLKVHLCHGDSIVDNSTTETDYSNLTYSPAP